MPDITGEVIAGTILTLLGVFSIARKRFSLDFGRRGFFNPQPLVTFILTDGRAVLFGWISLISGIGILGLCVYVFITLNASIVEQGIALVVTILGVSITILTFLFEIVIEFLVHMNEKHKD